MLDKILDFLQAHRLGTYLVAISSVLALYMAEETTITDMRYDNQLLSNQNENLKHALTLKEVNK